MKKIPKHKGLIYRGMSNQEFVNAKRNGYFKSIKSFYTYFSDNPPTAEDYGENIPFHPVSTFSKPNYIIAVRYKSGPTWRIISYKDIPKNVNLQEQMKFKEIASGDDYALEGTLPFSKAIEIYEFSVIEKGWKRIK